MTTPEERAFVFFPRGQVRDDLLTEWRLGLAELVNPETGALFTQDEIAQATQQGSRWWIEADAIDLIGMAIQSRALFLADQVRVDRASSTWLVNYHGDQWLGEPPLPASPGSGLVENVADPGTIFIGSTTVPDPTATTYRDSAGLRYQILTTATADGSGLVQLTLIGIDTGEATNLKVGAELTLDLNPPLGAQPSAKVVLADFRGGLPTESMADYANRILARIRHRQGAGNDAHLRAWARDSSNAVLDAFVYACAMHAGSTLVSVLQKRGSTKGPNALVANAGTLASVTGYLVPPVSPVVPTRVFLVVTTFTPAPSDLVLQLAQPKGNTAGWHDVAPWPGYVSAPAQITAMTDSTHFRMHSDTDLPNGATSLSGAAVPQLMLWDPGPSGDTASRWVLLSVTSVTSVGSGLFDIVLATAPVPAPEVGDWVSPGMARRATLAETIEQYFDGLGPGEEVDLATDTRADRAARFPDPGEEFPYRGGQSIITPIVDALGASLSNVQLASMSLTTPPLPVDVIDGPSKLTLGRVGVYDLP